MPKLHLVVNRRARQLTGDGRAYAALARAADRFVVHDTRSLDDLAATARRISEGGADAVVLAGGDGTVMAGVTALTHAFAGALPPIAIAPFGTVNTIASNWGFRGTPERYAARLLAAIAGGVATRRVRASLRITDDHDGDRVGFIFGAGLVARFFEAYDAAPTQGNAAAARLVARIFAGSLTGAALSMRVLTPAACRLTVDGQTKDAGAYSLIVASVLPNLGLGMRVTYRAAERIGRVHLVASGLGARGLAAQLPRVLLGRRLVGRDHVDCLAERFTVRFEHEDAYVLDGELLRAREVRVVAGGQVGVLEV